VYDGVVRATSTTVLLMSLFACGGDDARPVCVAGRVEACPCIGGSTGIQTCLADGTFGACMCGDADGGPVDAGDAVDAGDTPDSGEPIDAGETADGGGRDAGSVDGGSADAGPPPPGHAVLMAFGGIFVDEAADGMIANSVLLSGRSGPLRVLEYAEWEGGGAGAYPHLTDVITAAAAGAGRPATFTPLVSAFGLSAALATTDVLLVPPQCIASSDDTLRAIGTGWQPDLLAFLDAGGVVLVLTCDSRPVGGGSSAPGGEWLLTGGLFTTSSVAPRNGSVPYVHEVTAPSDPIARGVLSPFASYAPCFQGSTGGTVVARRDATALDAPLCPVVRHLER
jgi:hypothetical protein